MDDKASRSSAAAVSVAGLSKRYGVTEAVSGVSFEVGAGQIFGLLGPNGAGKTTTLECILGLRQPDSGSIQIDGSDLRTHATRAKLLGGAQLQSAALQDQITPRPPLRRAAASIVSCAGTDQPAHPAGAGRAHRRSRSAVPSHTTRLDWRYANGGQDGLAQHSRS